MLLFRNSDFNYCFALREKVSKYGVISGPYFPVFGLNTESCEVLGHFSRSADIELVSRNQMLDLQIFMVSQHRIFDLLIKSFIYGVNQ